MRTNCVVGSWGWGAIPSDNKILVVLGLLFALSRPSFSLSPRPGEVAHGHSLIK